MFVCGRTQVFSLLRVICSCHSVRGGRAVGVCTRQLQKRQVKFYVLVLDNFPCCLRTCEAPFFLFLSLVFPPFNIKRRGVVLFALEERGRGNLLVHLKQGHAEGVHSIAERICRSPSLSWQGCFGFGLHMVVYLRVGWIFRYYIQRIIR